MKTMLNPISTNPRTLDRRNFILLLGAVLTELQMATDDALAAERQDCQEQINQLNQQIADLQRQLEECQGSHQNATKIGAWCPPISGESTFAQAQARFEATCGPIEIVRSFDDGKGARVAVDRARQQGLGQKYIIQSFKASPANMPSGQYDSDINYMFESFNNECNGKPVRWVYEHECDKKVIKDKLYSWDQFRAGWSRVWNISQNHNTSLLIPTLVLTGWDFINRIGNCFIEGQMDEVGVDQYCDGPNQSAQSKNGAAFNWCQDHGVRIGAAEIGPLNYTDTNEVKEFIQSYQWMIDNEFSFITEFNETKSDGAMRIDNNAVWAEAYSNLPRSN